MSEQSTELAPLPAKRFRNIVKDAIRDFMDPSNDPGRAVEFFFNQLRTNAAANMSLFLQFLDLSPRPSWDISFYLNQPGSTPKQGEYFDFARRNINELISHLFEYPPNQTTEEKERMMKFARLIYSQILRSYIGKSLLAGDHEFKNSLKGIAWSVLAKDIDGTLVPKGQKCLSSKWKNQMRKMIFSDKPDMKAVVAELKNFEQGSKEVFPNNSDQ